jgi:hypothetical protein
MLHYMMPVIRPGGCSCDELRWITDTSFMMLTFKLVMAQSQRATLVARTHCVIMSVCECGVMLSFAIHHVLACGQLARTEHARVRLTATSSCLLCPAGKGILHV